MLPTPCFKHTLKTKYTHLLTRQWLYSCCLYSLDGVNNIKVYNPISMLCSPLLPSSLLKWNIITNVDYFCVFNKEVCKWPSHEPFDRNWSSLASLQLGVQKLFNNFVKNIYVIFFAFWNTCESVGWCNNELTDSFLTIKWWDYLQAF